MNFNILHLNYNAYSSLQECHLYVDNMDDFITTKRAFNKSRFGDPLRHYLTGEQGLDYLFQRNEFSDVMHVSGLALPAEDTA